MNYSIVLGLSLLLMLGGLVGVLYPVLPAIPLVWLGIFFYGIFTEFADLSNRFLWIVSGLAVLTFLFDYINVLWGTRRFEVTGWSVIGAVLGGFIGSLFGIFHAVFVGPLLGVLVVEMLHGRDVAFSYRSGHYRIIGFIGGLIFKLALGITMIGLFLYQVIGPGGI